MSKQSKGRESGNTGLAALDTIRGPIGWWAFFVVAAALLFFATVAHTLPQLRSSIFYQWSAAVIGAFMPAPVATTTTPVVR